MSYENSGRTQSKLDIEQNWIHNGVYYIYRQSYKKYDESYIKYEERVSQTVMGIAMS